MEEANYVFRALIKTSGENQHYDLSKCDEHE